MIEKMLRVQIVTTSGRKAVLLDALRELEILHISEKAVADKACTDRFMKLSSLSLALKDYGDGNVSEEILSDDAFKVLYQRVDDALERKKELSSQRAVCVTEAEKLREWGNFSPSDVEELRKKGIDLHFYRMGKKEYESIAKDESLQLIKLTSVGKMETFACVGELPKEIPANEFALPEKGLDDLEKTILSCDEELRACDVTLKEASIYSKSFADQMLKVQNEEDYSAVSNSVSSDEGLVWLIGYIPASDEEKFKRTASENNWAYSIDNVEEGDEYVPTKVRYNKLTRLMIPVFDILGTVPGYREYDISFWFLGFFTLFFAMIIGDAGYGLIFLIAAVILHAKMKKANDAVMLLYVLSIATVIWGSLTGTWFGLEGAMNVPFLKALVIPKFANYPEYFGVTTTGQQNAIMKFCFIIGTVQLSLACVMNVKTKLARKDLSWISDVGWLAAICALYFVVLYLVIGENVNLAPVAVIVICGFLLVVLFGGMAPDKSFSQGLKSGLGDAFTVFLNTISAFGNIMSYIRLFAVGMASLAIAQSFNNMASGFTGPAVVVGAFIMIIGHVLNIVMGILSVVVHGVRLNLLEFSGQLGMEWSGKAYDPFRKLKKIKN